MRTILNYNKILNPYVNYTTSTLLSGTTHSVSCCTSELFFCVRRFNPTRIPTEPAFFVMIGQRAEKLSNPLFESELAANHRGGRGEYA